MNQAALIQRINKLKDSLIVKRWKVATAESCTGGLLSSVLTDASGSSAFFTGGIVAYDNSVKLDVLHINPDLLASKGAVSREVACAMAQGVADLLKVNIALATTGIAGPTGGTPEKPVGTVWLALAINGCVKAKNLALKGDRTAIRWQTVESAIAALETVLKDGDW